MEVAHCVGEYAAHSHSLCGAGLDGDASAGQVLPPVVRVDAELAVVDGPAVPVDVEEELAPHLSNCVVLDVQADEESGVSDSQLAVGQGATEADEVVGVKDSRHIGLDDYRHGAWVKPTLGYGGLVMPFP